MSRTYATRHAVLDSAESAKSKKDAAAKPRQGHRETVEAIVLNTTEGAEIRIPRASIEELQQGRVSIMPQGLDRILQPDELRDLLAFLSSQREQR